MRIKFIAAFLFFFARLSFVQAQTEILSAIGESDPLEIEAIIHGGLDKEKPARRRFGKLEYRGGLRLHSDDSRFGGLSGLATYGEGSRLLTISDRGDWIGMRLHFDKGKPIGVSDGWIASMRDAKGKVLSGRMQDAEALSLDLATDRIFVGFEHEHRIWGYGKNRVTDLAIADSIRYFPENKGIEALATTPEGVTIAVSEGVLQGLNHEIVGWYMRPGQTPIAFSIKRDRLFAPSGADFAPNGDFYLLERFFSAFAGIQMRIRRFRWQEDMQQIFARGPLQGEVLASFDIENDIDNMEGISVISDPDNPEVFLIYLISDNNFLPIQRTLLLVLAVGPQRQ